jgi:hypothetical protein
MGVITKTLSMKFGMDDGKSRNISIAHCKDGLLAEDVIDVMDTMIDRQIFKFGLAARTGASVTTREVDELF